MKILLTKRKLVKHILGVIYALAPGNYPRNIDKIHEYIIKYCKENIKDYHTEIDSSELQNYIKNMMLNCEEFTQLNISQKRWDKGIRNYKDKNNSGFAFTAVGHDDNGIPCTMYTVKEYSDFVDLDAVFQNVSREIIIEEEQDEDCFLCKFAGKYGNMEPTDCKECNTCCINPNYKFNRIPHPKSLLPRNSEEYKNYKE